MNDLKKKKIGVGSIILLVLCVVIFLFSASLILQHFKDVNDNKKTYEELSQLVSTTVIGNLDDENAEESDVILDFSPLLKT